MANFAFMTLQEFDRNCIISDFVATAPRHRLVVVGGCAIVPGLPALDVGLSVARYIRGRRFDDLKLQVREYLDTLFAENITTDSVYGKYICLSNIGILFEPELGLNVTDIVASLSRNILVILPVTGVVDSRYVYFLNASSRHRIDLGRLNYVLV